MISCEEYTKFQKDTLKTLLSVVDYAPKLVVIQVDDDYASSKYIKWKKFDCEYVGIQFEHKHIDSTITDQYELEKIIQDYNNDSSVTGIIIQLPIPKKYDLDRLQGCIDRIKDVDGFRKDSYWEPCTARGVISWIKYNKIELAGKVVAVLNRSPIVGRPLIDMLIDESATVICCNSHTADIQEHVRNADIVITATGKPKMINEYWFRYPYSTELIIDVGINYDEETHKTCGDVDYEALKDFYGLYVTPVPGGVGLLTRTALLHNIVRAQYIQNEWNTKY